MCVCVCVRKYEFETITREKRAGPRVRTCVTNTTTASTPVSGVSGGRVPVGNVVRAVRHDPNGFGATGIEKYRFFFSFLFEKRAKTMTDVKTDSNRDRRPNPRIGTTHVRCGDGTANVFGPHDDTHV